MSWSTAELALEAAAAAAEQEQHQQHDDDDQEQGSESHLASLRVRAPAYPARERANQPELPRVVEAVAPNR
jgi:hypothetical protein